MSDMSQDLEGHYQVQRSKIANHPEYASQVLMTQYGWAKRGQETNWYETKIESIKAKLKEDFWAKVGRAIKPMEKST